MKFKHIFYYIIILINTAMLNGQLPTTEMGLIERLSEFPSEYVTERYVDIWTPEGYDKSKKYPVIYMHDGQMLFDSTNTWNHQEWKVDEVLSQLITDNKTPACIVVGIHNSKERHADYFPQKAFEILPEPIKESYTNINTNEKPVFPNGPHADDYLKFIVKELKPFIDSNFSTVADSTGTFIMGSSMGGLISMYAMFEYPSVFGGAACLSTHWIGGYDDNDNPIPAAFLHYMNKHIPDPKTHMIYFDHGTEGLDSMYVVHQLNVNDALRDAGYEDGKNLLTKVYEGHDHNEKYWADRIDQAFIFLLKND